VTDSRNINLNPYSNDRTNQRKNKLPPWKRIYVEDADVCSRTGFGLFVFNQGHDSAEPKKIGDAKISLFVFGREKNSNFRF